MTSKLKIFYWIKLSFYLFSAPLFSNSYVENEEMKTKREMVQTLNVIKQTMEIQYAPAEWKKEFLNWNIEYEYDKAVKQIMKLNAFSVKNFQQILKEFLGSTQDYHVQVSFYSTESSFLPFSIKTVNQKSYVDWIDVKNWPSNQKLLELGDEILYFNGVAVSEIIEEIIKKNGRKMNTATDQSIADHIMTLRLGSAAHDVLKGGCEIVAQNSTGEIKIVDLQWNYRPERIQSPFIFLFQYINNFGKQQMSIEEEITSLLQKQRMITPNHLMQLNERSLRHGEIGATLSHLPLLGEPIWKYPNNKFFLQENEREENGEILHSKQVNWFAYIYKNENGRPIGYLRIPHYSGTNEDFLAVVPLIAYLEKNSDALIIDQLNNPGGYVSFMHQILSLLTPYPLTIPKHRVAINQKEVMEAIEEIEKIKNFNFFENLYQSEMLNQVISYYEYIIEEWNRGQTLTDPIHLGGIDFIQPYRIHYSKPLLMLINELDFSAADFAPAILQDNFRAQLMGNKTAGAGGAVASLSFPNRFGIKEVSFTDTIAERINEQKIEDLGVTPDIIYEISEEDLQTNYHNYKKIINQEINYLIENQSF